MLQKFTRKLNLFFQFIGEHHQAHYLLRTKLAANVADTKPYARDRSSTVVTSATYANTTENVTANTPLIEIIAKNHLEEGWRDIEDRLTTTHSVQEQGEGKVNTLTKS